MQCPVPTIIQKALSCICLVCLDRQLQIDRHNVKTVPMEDVVMIVVSYVDRFCVASTQEMALIFPDRIIAVRGTIENMSKAEVAISTLLRECMEKDMQSAVQLAFCVCHSTGRNLLNLVPMYLMVHCFIFLLPILVSYFHFMTLCCSLLQADICMLRHMYCLI